jgi:hypothetical protein
MSSCLTVTTQKRARSDRLLGNRGGCGNITNLQAGSESFGPQNESLTAYSLRNERHALWGSDFSVSQSNFDAGQAVGLQEVHDDIWLVSFMDYDLGYFELETRVLEPLENPFGPKVLPI